MDNGQSAMDKTSVNPFTVTIAVEVLPYSLVLEGSQDFAEGSGARRSLCGSNTGVESHRSVVQLAYVRIGAVAGRTVFGSFLDIPLTVPSGVWREAASIDIVLVHVGLPVAVVDRRIVL